MLANLGARVIKIEEPELGDPVRAAPPFRSGHSLLAESLLSGLESVALDLKKEGGREVLGTLIDKADVLIETFRPGTLARLGLDPVLLRQQRPGLVICSISGWGRSGPLAARSGHDLTYQAASGALAATGRPPNLPSADLLGAWSAVAAICAALFAREQSNHGTWIDASLFDSAVVGNVTNLSAGASAGLLPDPGPLTGALPCYRIYRTRDGRLFALAALEEKFWRSFCKAVERPDLVGLQYQNLFAELDLPGEIVMSPEEALAGGQARARHLSSVTRGGVPFPVTLEGERPAVGGSLPRLGEHTREVLSEFCPSRLRASRRERLAAGIGPRLRLRRSMRGWIGSLKG
jgi:crotonobetainyl-CoA:carnitine CoA-transferase CaiB-like acyl-CoA transferase